MVKVIRVWKKNQQLASYCDIRITSYIFLKIWLQFGIFVSKVHHTPTLCWRVKI